MKFVLCAMLAICLLFCSACKLNNKNSKPKPTPTVQESWENFEKPGLDINDKEIQEIQDIIKEILK